MSRTEDLFGEATKPKKLSPLTLNSLIQSCIPLWQKLHSCFGLSEYEAKVYVSLITCGASQVGRLSTVCGVPRSKIYKTLQKLVNRGLVTEIPEEPRVYAPTSPIDAFKPFIESLKQKKYDLESVLSLLEHVFKRKRLQSNYLMETMWIIRGQSKILRKIQEMMAKAKGAVEIVSTEEMLLPVYKKCNKLFDQLSVRKVRVRVRIPADSPNSYFIRELKYICKVEKVNFWSRMVFINVDQQEFLLAKFTDSEELGSENNDVAVYSNNMIFCKMLSTLLSDVIGKVRLFGKMRKKPLVQ